MDDRATDRKYIRHAIPLQSRANGRHLFGVLAVGEDGKIGAERESRQERGGGAIPQGNDTLYQHRAMRAVRRRQVSMVGPALAEEAACAHAGFRDHG